MLVSLCCVVLLCLVSGVGVWVVSCACSVLICAPSVYKRKTLANAIVLPASAIAGFFASFFSLPFDFVKTRLQKQTRGADGKLPYKGMTDCFAKVAREEGLMRFYRGYVCDFLLPP